MKRFSVALLLVICGPFISRAQEQLSVPDLLKRAQAQNPDIQAAYQKWKVAEQDAGVAGVWPNPKFTYIDEKDPMGQQGVQPLARHHLSAEQDIPFPGKLSTDARMKHHEARIAEAAYRDIQLDVFGKVKVAAAKLGSLTRLIDLSKQNVSAMKQTVGTAQSRLAANKGMATDVFMAQMELQRMENMVFEKQQERRQIELELNALVNENIENSWADVSRANYLNDLPLSLTELLKVAEKNNPHIQSAHHEVNHSQAMLRRSRLEFAPDFGLMYEYQTAGDGIQGVGESGRQLGLSLSVPLWLARPYRMAKSARFHIEEAQAMQTSMGIMVHKMVASEYTEVVTHLTLARKYDAHILPAAKAALNTSREQYAAGRGDFLRLLEANRAWINVNEEHESQIYHTAEHWTELERWVGTSIEAAAEEKRNEK